MKEFKWTMQLFENLKIVSSDFIGDLTRAKKKSIDHIRSARISLQFIRRCVCSGEVTIPVISGRGEAFFPRSGLIHQGTANRIVESFFHEHASRPTMQQFIGLYGNFINF